MVLRSTILLLLFPLLGTCVTRYSGPECGDGIVQQEEECDCASGASPPAGCATTNGDFYGASCHSNCELPRCGDAIRDEGEECDGAQLGTATCESYGFLGGTLVCDASCLHDTTGCTGP